tara:strand:- start:682 stop:969 length:288 start_codon:yes stop_codon:yes gene_type:complete
MNHCESCWTALDENSIVEWIALDDGTCLEGSIRQIHKSCSYYDTDSKWLDDNHFWDRCVPISKLGKYIELALGMQWDDIKLAELKFRNIKRCSNG